MRTPQSHPTLSLVVPIFNEEESIATFFERVTPELQRLDASWEVICVNDGSRDGSLDRLLTMQAGEPRLKVLDLTRNFGKEAALTAGLARAAGDAVVPIDIDLQDPPATIGPMLAKWREGYDMVYAVRARRDSDSRLKRWSADLFYRAYNRVSAVEIPPNAGDFRLLDRRVVEAMGRLPERNRFMKGLFAWLGFRQTYVIYDRGARGAGDSKWNFWKLWNFALDGITSFSTVPLRIWSYLGVSIAGLAFVYALFLIVRTLLYGADVPGYASMMVVVLFLGGLQLLTLGIIGEYLGRTYQEVKARPLYLVRDAYGFDAVHPASHDHPD